MSLEAKLRAAEKTKDPLARSLKLHVLLRDAQAFQSEVSTARARAVTAANDSGLPYPKIAERLGVTKSLVQIIVRKGRLAQSAA